MFLISKLKSLTEDEFGFLAYLVNTLYKPTFPFDHTTAAWFKADFIASILNFAGDKVTEEGAALIKGIREKIF